MGLNVLGLLVVWQCSSRVVYGEVLGKRETKQTNYHCEGNAATVSRVLGQSFAPRRASVARCGQLHPNSTVSAGRY